MIARISSSKRLYPTTTYLILEENPSLSRKPLVPYLTSFHAYFFHLLPFPAYSYPAPLEITTLESSTSQSNLYSVEEAAQVAAKREREGERENILNPLLR